MTDRDRERKKHKDGDKSIHGEKIERQTEREKTDRDRERQKYRDIK